MGFLDQKGLEQVWGKATQSFAGKGTVYTKDETDAAVSTAIGQAVSGIYKVKGSVAFADLPTTEMKEGYVYNITDEFTADNTFVESEQGKKYPAGTNIVYTEAGWDAMAGIYDFSDFMMKSDLEDITAAEIDAICVIPEA